MGLYQLTSGTYIIRESDGACIPADPYVAPTPLPSSQAQLLLDKADITMLRIAEAVSLGLNSWTGADVVMWVNYRRSLRTIVSSNIGPLLTQPAYPAGT